MKGGWVCLGQIKRFCAFRDDTNAPVECGDVDDSTRSRVGVIGRFLAGSADLFRHCAGQRSGAVAHVVGGGERDLGSLRR